MKESNGNLYFLPHKQFHPESKDSNILMSNCLYMLFSDKPDNWVQRELGYWHEPFTALRAGKKNLEWRKWQEHKCANCGIKSLRFAKKVKYCTNHCANQIIKKFGKDHRRWNNGEAHCSSGYIMVLTSRKPRKYTFQHRLIMQQHLGRELLLSEIVHHKNHNKSDNRLENLQVVSRSEHIRLHRPHSTQ